MLQDLAKKNRSYRRFEQTHAVSRNVLEGLIETARYSASTANLQPLRYYLSHEANTNDKIFPTTRWAGYLSDWPGPNEGERPAAYLVICHDTAIKIKSEFLWCDAGLAAQHIMMTAAEQELGGCIIASFDKKQLAANLSLAPQYDPLLVIALGKPLEHVVITEATEDSGIRYYRDEEGTHFVPKRSLSDLIIH